MRIRHLFIAITLILTSPFHLLGNDQLDPNLCYTPGGTTQAPDWVCGSFEDVDGYSDETKFAVGQSGRPSNPNELLAYGIADLASFSADVVFSSNGVEEVMEVQGQVTAKVIDKFSTPTEDYILVAEAPEGITYDVSQVILNKTDTSGFGDNETLHSSSVSLVKIGTVENDKNSMLGCFLMISEGAGDDELFVHKELDAEECRQEFVKMSFTLAFAKKERTTSQEKGKLLYQQFLRDSAQNELEAEMDAFLDAEFENTNN